MVFIKLGRENTKASPRNRSFFPWLLHFLFHIDYSNSFRKFINRIKSFEWFICFGYFLVESYKSLYLCASVFSMCMRFTQCYNQIQSIYHKPILSSKLNTWNILSIVTQPGHIFSALLFACKTFKMIWLTMKRCLQPIPSQNRLGLESFKQKWSSANSTWYVNPSH